MSPKVYLLRPMYGCYSSKITVKFDLSRGFFGAGCRVALLYWEDNFIA
jgi:hypothetical protein